MNELLHRIRQTLIKSSDENTRVGSQRYFKETVKRASAVTLIIPAGKGLFLTDIFEIADILLTDVDDMVQKGYSWMLKVASQSNQQSVFEYVLSKKNVMPGTALRYAIEKMPGGLKKTAMKK